MKPIILEEGKRQKIIEKCIDELYEKTFKHYLNYFSFLLDREIYRKAKEIEPIIDDMYEGKGDPNETKKRALEKIKSCEEGFNVFLEMKAKFDREFERIESFLRGL